MILARLKHGTRFRAIEAPEITGTLIHVSEGSATVELDGKPRLRDFETYDHQWVRICQSGKRRTTITKFMEVVPIRPNATNEVQS